MEKNLKVKETKFKEEQSSTRRKKELIESIITLQEEEKKVRECNPSLVCKDPTEN